MLLGQRIPAWPGTTGNVALTTGGGSVSAERVSGDLTLTTDGGDITVRQS